MRPGLVCVAAAGSRQLSTGDAPDRVPAAFTRGWRVTVALVLLCWAVTVPMAAAGHGELMSPLEDSPAGGQFALPDIEGQVRRLSDYQGRFLLVNFWATWCTPCRQEMPSLNLLSEKFAEAGVDVVAIHVGPGGEEIHQFLDRTPVGFTVLVDESMTSMSDWKVVGIPVTYLVDRDGRILYRAVGERDWASPEMTRFIERIIK